METRNRPDLKALAPQGHVRITSRKNKKGNITYRAKTIAENHEGTLVSDQPIDSRESIITNIIAAMQTFGGTKVLVEERSPNTKSLWFWLNADRSFNIIPSENY